MGAFKRRDDPLQPCQELKGLQGFLISHGLVGHTSGVLEVAMLRPYAWIIQASGDRVRGDDLAIIILQKIAHAPMQHPQTSGTQRGTMLARGESQAGSLDA